MPTAFTCVHKSVTQQGRLVVLGSDTQLLEADGSGQVLSQRVPPEVVFLEQLLDVLGSGATGASLQEHAAVEEGHHRQHLGGSAKLEDGEQVGQVVPEHLKRTIRRSIEHHLLIPLRYTKSLRET